MKYLASSLTLLLGLSLSGCGSILSSRQNTSNRSDLSLDEVRLELADVRHELKSTQVELNLLDEQFKKQTLSSFSKQGESGVTLDKKIANLEKLLEKAAVDLRNLSTHTNQALAKLTHLEQEVSLHEKRLDEVVRLKETLTSISHAIGDSHPSSTSNTVYKVKAGDSLEKIARANKISVPALKNLNHLKSDKIVVGQELRVSDDTP